MKTSYFFSPKLKETDKLISIAGMSPPEIKKKFPNMKTYGPLQPPKKLVYDYKEGRITEEEYTRQYNEQLSRLDSRKVYDILGEDSILLCWEWPKNFCHRRLVSKWFKEKLGIEVEEL